MSKVFKKIFIILIVLTFFMCNIVLASSGPRSNAAAAEIKASGSQILSAVLWFGYAVSLGMVVFIGIKYMLGAADAKANMKSAIVSWLIGAFIVFMCTTIVGWVLGIVNGTEDDGSGLAEDIVNAVVGD